MYNSINAELIYHMKMLATDLVQGVIKNTVNGRISGEKTPIYYTGSESASIGISLKLSYNSVIGLKYNIEIVGGESEEFLNDIKQSLLIYVDEYIQYLQEINPEELYTLMDALKNIQTITDEEQVTLTHNLYLHNCIQYN